MIAPYDTYTATIRLRHWVRKGHLKTLCGYPVQVNRAPDSKMRRLEPCKACARRLTEGRVS